MAISGHTAQEIGFDFYTPIIFSLKQTHM